MMRFWDAGERGHGEPAHAALRCPGRGLHDRLVAVDGAEIGTALGKIRDCAGYGFGNVECWPLIEN
jgi:hypothetical protein